MSENEVRVELQTQPGQKRKGCRGCLLWMGIIAGVVALLLCLWIKIQGAGHNVYRTRPEAALRAVTHFLQSL
jgi:hypothetical protein